MFRCEYSLFSIGDNIIDKFIQLACIRYKKQNAVAHGCQNFVTILRQPQFKKLQRCPTLHYDRKKFQTDTCFRKEKGRHDKNIKRFASGNVNIVYATSLLFDTIDRFCPKKCQKSKSCSANR